MLEVAKGTPQIKLEGVLYTFKITIVLLRLMHLRVYTFPRGAS
jgi:hypothetical protein